MLCVCEFNMCNHTYIHRGQAIFKYCMRACTNIDVVIYLHLPKCFRFIYALSLIVYLQTYIYRGYTCARTDVLCTRIHTRMFMYMYGQIYIYIYIYIYVYVYADVGIFTDTYFIVAQFLFYSTGCAALSNACRRCLGWVYSYLDRVL